MMKSLLSRNVVWTWLVVALCVGWSAPLARATAPATAAGKIYYEQSLVDIRSNVAFARILRPDGTYREIYLMGTYGAITLRNPSADGTYTYQKTDDTHAVLTFSNGVTPGISPTSDSPRNLTFATDENGLLSYFSLSGGFSLVDPASRPPMVNCSNRATVPAGGLATTGFVLAKETNRVLVRAVGPGLKPFGVANALPAPVLTVTGRIPMAQNTGWSTMAGKESLRRAAEIVGAFPLADDSADSALLLVLPAGAYTAQATSAQSGASGEVLIEVYTLGGN